MQKDKDSLLRRFDLWLGYRVHRVKTFIQKQTPSWRKEIAEQYNEMAAEIESVDMFDGRGRGVDVYICDKCGGMTFTRYKDKGVTPFTITCEYCGAWGMLHKHTLSEWGVRDRFPGAEVKNWIRPTLKETMRLGVGTIEHVVHGGLVLEEEVKGRIPAPKPHIYD
jgi:hypothetical protein